MEELYYSVSEIDAKTHLIKDKKNVYMYLLEGDEKALLIDTGYGDPGLPALLSSLTEKPITVVNTHIHPDHIGGNYLFKEVYAPKADIAPPGELSVFEEMERRVFEAMKKKWSFKNFFFRKMLAGFAYKKADSPPLPLPESNEIDLGGRNILFLYCPGHTPGSVMFLDPLTKTVFAGDSLGIWLFTNPKQKLDPYIGKLKKTADLKGYEKVWMSHVGTARDFSYINDFIDFLESTKTSKPKKIKIPGFDSPLYMFNKKDEKQGFFSAWYFKSQL